MWSVWLGCAPVHAPPTSSAELMEILAGPRAVREQPPEPLPADAPGGGPFPAYADALRVAVDDAMDACLGSARRPKNHAIVVATIGEDGDLLGVRIDQSSGDAGFDTCILVGFREADLPLPPADLLENGQMETPKLAFR